MSKAAIVLICDNNYLIPTVASALSARANTARDAADVIIYVLDRRPSWKEQGVACLAKAGLHLQWVDIPEYQDLARFHRDRYLPPITLARFWIDRFLPEGTDRFLYIDGDVMVDDNLDTLLSQPPEHGKIAVAPDNLQVFTGEVGKSIEREQQYLDGIGVPCNDYFNAGVVYTSVRPWKEIVPEAIRFFKEHPERCRSSDQSALNHAARGRTVMLSQTFNYQTEHMMIRDPRTTGQRVKIFHFTGGPKPWIAPGWPWDDYFNRFYRQAEALCAEFDVLLPKAPVAQTDAGVSHRRRFRQRQTWVYPWRRLSRRKALDKLLALPTRADPHLTVPRASQPR